MKYIKLSSKVNLIIHLIVKIKRDDVFALASQFSILFNIIIFPIYVIFDDFGWI